MGVNINPRRKVAPNYYAQTFVRSIQGSLKSLPALSSKKIYWNILEKESQMEYNFEFFRNNNFIQQTRQEKALKFRAILFAEQLRFCCVCNSTRLVEEGISVSRHNYVPDQLNIYYL